MILKVLRCRLSAVTLGGFDYYKMNFLLAKLLYFSFVKLKF